MERKQRFMVGLLTTAITYSSLMFFVGPRHYVMSEGYRHHRVHGWYKHNDCGKEGSSKWYRHRPENKDNPDTNSTQTNQ